MVGSKLVRSGLAMSACVIVLAIAFLVWGYLDTGNGLFVLGASLFAAVGLAAIWLVALFVYGLMRLGGTELP